VYARDADEIDFNKVGRTQTQKEGYSNPDDDPRGPWASRDFTAQGYRPNQMYEIETPGGALHEPPPDRCWANVKSEFERLRDDDRIWFGTDGNARPRVKNFLSESEGVSSWTWWPNEKVGHNQEATKELIELLPEVDSGEYTPKPTRLIQRILQIATDPGDLVLDSFAGSGTTGHAVMKQNAEDGGNRRFILVEMEPEVAREVCAERLRRAAAGYDYTGNDYDVLFSKKLGVRTFEDAENVLQQMKMLKQEHAEEYDRFERRVKDGQIMLRGKKEIEDRKEGLGGGFRYCTLGPVLMDEHGQIRRDVSYDALARHVHYSATGRPLPANGEAPEPPLIHAGDEAAYYLLYNGVLGDDRPKGGNVLTRRVLDGLPALPNGASSRIVFGTACRLSERELSARGVRFRQIPYQIRTE
jgi:hypothetical protein